VARCRSCTRAGSWGIALWLAALHPEALRVVQRSPVGVTLGRERKFVNLREAVAVYAGDPAAAAVLDGRLKISAGFEGELE
jgi:hypothetical protein